MQKHRQPYTHTQLQIYTQLKHTHKDTATNTHNYKQLQKHVTINTHNQTEHTINKHIQSHIHIQVQLHAYTHTYICISHRHAYFCLYATYLTFEGIWVYVPLLEFQPNRRDIKQLLRNCKAAEENLRSTQK